MGLEKAQEFIEKVSADPEIKQLFGMFTLDELKEAAKEMSAKAAFEDDDCSYNLC